MGIIGHIVRERLRDNLFEFDNRLSEMMKHVSKKHNPARAARSIIEFTTKGFLAAAKDACGEGKIMFRRTKSWWDDDCTELHTKWNEANAKARTTRAEADATLAAQLKKDWKLMKRDKKAKLNEEQDDEAIKSYKRNNPNWWSMVRGMQNKGNLKVDAAFINGLAGISTNDDQEMAEVFRKHYEKLAKDTHKPHFEQEWYLEKIEEVKVILEDKNKHPDLEYNRDIIRKDIEEARKTLHHGKAAGMDGVAPEIIKCGKEESDKILAKVFNFCYENGTIHSKAWRKAKIVSLHKAGDKRIPGNYRGISLHSVMGKMYASILNSRLSKYLEGKKLLATGQNGFRTGVECRSCEDHLFTLTENCKLMVRQGRRPYLFFLDFSKAFDTVNHKLLMYKLRTQMKVKGKLLKAIESLYKNLTAVASINGKNSKEFQLDRDCARMSSQSHTLRGIHQ